MLFRNTKLPKKLKQGMGFKLADSATMIVDRPILTTDEVRQNKPVIEERRILILEIAVVW